MNADLKAFRAYLESQRKLCQTLMFEAKTTNEDQYRTGRLREVTDVIAQFDFQFAEYLSE